MIAEDQLRIIISMVITIPLSYAIPKIPNALARQLYSLIVGTLIQYYIYGQEIILVFALHVFVYFITMFTPRNCGIIVTWSTLGFLSFFHIYRMIVDYGGWNLDVSTIIMSNICKYSLFAYAYQDGQTHKYLESKDQNHNEVNKQNSSKLTQQQINQKIQTLPSFLKFVGYCQFLPGSPISTPFPYKYYEDYIQLRNQYSKIPSPWDQIKSDLLYSVVLVLLYLPNLFFFPLNTMKDPTFANQSFWYIMYFSFFCVTTLRFKYYFAWKLSLGAIHASGVSFQRHKNGTSDFKLIQTCNPHIVQTTVHIREKIANWNMTCQQWLRKCVYERSHFKNKTHGQMLTFLVSSFWHGFYGGYYFTFVLWFIQLFTSQAIFKQCKNQNSKFTKIYNLAYPFSKYIVWIIWNISFTICGISFQVLSSSQSFRLLKSLYFTPFLFFAVIHLALTFGGTKQKKDRKKGNEEKKIQ